MPLQKIAKGASKNHHGLIIVLCKKFLILTYFAYKLNTKYESNKRHPQSDAEKTQKERN